MPSRSVRGVPGFTRKRKREAKRLEGGSARHEGDVVDNIDVEPPVFDAETRDGVRRAGRPPKHTCGRAPKAPLDNDVAHRRPVVRRVCYSHEYIGPGRHQQKGPVEDVNEEELKASTMLKLMTTEQIPEMAEIVLVSAFAHQFWGKGDGHQQAWWLPRSL
eukprot:g9288.t1